MVSISSPLNDCSGRLREQGISSSLVLLIIALLVGMLAPQPTPSTQTRSSDALVALADMIPPQLAYSRLQGNVDARRHIALSIGLRPQNDLRLYQYLRTI